MGLRKRQRGEGAKMELKDVKVGEVGGAEAEMSGG